MPEHLDMWAFLFFVSRIFRRHAIWEPRIMSVATIPEIEERHSREAIEAEIVRFEEKARQLQSGAITAEQFRPFGLKHGTSSQRQTGFQILTFKTAAGVLTSLVLCV